MQSQRMTRMTSALEEYMKKELKKSYRYPDDAFNDIYIAAKDFPYLHVSTNPYEFPDGKRQDLLRFDCSIQPINKGEKEVSIHVGIWFPTDYPARPPMVHVIPTPGMTFSRHMPPNGRVEVPYLQTDNWKYPESNLEVLLEILMFGFGDRPPLVPNTYPVMIPQRLVTLANTTSLDKTFPVMNPSTSCSGCSSVMSMLQKQASEIAALKSEFLSLKREMKNNFSGRNSYHEMTSDSFDDDTVG